MLASKLLAVCAVLSTAVHHNCPVNPEMVAIRRMVLLNRGKTVYHAVNARDATATELVQFGTIGREIVENHDRGYRLDLRLPHSGREITAAPMVWHRDGRRTFFSDQSGALHQS